MKLDQTIPNHLRALGLAFMFQGRRARASTLSAALAEIVSEHGTIPSAYRAVLETFGSAPSAFEHEVVFDAPDIGQLSPEVLFGLAGERSLLHELRDARLNGLPSRLLPIAEDGAGSLFCLSSEDGVVYWDHGKVHKIAPSVESFLLGLKIDPSQNKVVDVSKAVVELRMEPPPLESIRGRLRNRKRKS